MKKLIIVIIALIAFSGVLPAQHLVTGNDLLDKLEKKAEYSSENLADVAFATGFVAGVFDSSHVVLLAAPDGVTLSQLCDIAMNYLKKHPEKRHEPASELLYNAFMEAFPLK